VNGMLFAKIDASDNKKYYHHDGLGSIVGISNSTPEVTTAQLFDDFGNWLYYDSNWDYYSYTGQEYDWPLTDAFNLRAREYYPEYGRFMQEDPIGNQGGSLNWYLYVANNPINFIDPEGFSKCTREEMNSEITKIKNIAIKWAKSIPYAERPFCGNLARDFERLINKSDFKCCNFTDVKTVGILKFQHNLTKIECSSCDNNNSTFCVDAWYRSSPIRACPNNATPTGWWQ
jgi:RHS repeat-associated protein